MIAARFQAGYVISDLDDAAFLERAEVDPGLEEVYCDRTAEIYRVLPSAEP
jgi:hypothetical protein